MLDISPEPDAAHQIRDSTDVPPVLGNLQLDDQIDEDVAEDAMKKWRKRINKKSHIHKAE
eukprot:2994769-Amphidinium_carterae.1